MKLFCGYDEREAVGYDVFVKSVKRRATGPVDIVRLDSCGLPVGSNWFTLSRFLCAELCGYTGIAVYMDACDMLCLGDVSELESLADGVSAVQVVKHSYKTRNPVKYIGTDMECPNRDYTRKNWASVMLINCAHPAWRTVTHEWLLSAPIVETLQLKFMADSDIGVIPNEWNRLVDEGQSTDGAKLYHWTAGTPFMDYYRDAPGAQEWRDEQAA